MKKIETYISDCGSFKFENGKLYLPDNPNIKELSIFLIEYLDYNKDDIDPKESRFLELIKDIKEIKPNLWVDSDNKWMIDNRGKDIVWVSYYRIWSVFEREFNMLDNDIQSFIKDMLSKHLKIEGKIPETSYLQHLT